MVSNKQVFNIDSTSEDGKEYNNFDYKKKLNNINKIIYNLDLYSNGYNFGHYFENNDRNINILKGGSVDEEEGDDSITITLKKYKRIKEFAKSAKNTIIKYRNLAQYYYDSYNTVLLNYMGLLQLLYKQKKSLEDKMEEYEKLSRDYSNGMDKIKLLETMINGIEKVVKHTTNLDLEIKNKIDGKEMNIKADAKLTPGDKSVQILDETIKMSGGGLIPILYGGEMDLYEFTNNLEAEINDLTDYGKQLAADNEFINNKVKSLHDRVKGIMGDTEELMNIRLSIEWMVNQLEKPNIAEEQEQEEQEKVDYQVIFDKLQNTINEVKNKKINQEVAKYIRDLEGMAKYFEDFITANKNTLSNIPKEQKKKMVETLKNIHGVSSNLFDNDVGPEAKKTDEGMVDQTAQLIGGYKTNKYGGGLQDDYNAINKNITNSINGKYKNSTLKVIFVDDENKIISQMINDDIDNIDIKQDKLYQIYVMSEELNKIFNLFLQYITTLRDINFQEYWNKLFENKNTDFYSKVKEYEIINISIDANNIKDIKANNFLTNIDKITDISKNIFYINYSIDLLDNIIGKLNRTIIFYHIFVFLMIDIKFFYLTFIPEDKSILGFDLSKVKSLIELYDNLTKSNTFYKFNEYFAYLQDAEKTKPTVEEVKTEEVKTEEVKTEEAKVGGVGEEQISSIYNVLSQELITSIIKPVGIDENVLADLYGKFNVSFSKVIAKSDEINDVKKFTGEIYKDVGKTIIKEDKILTKSMKDLVQKISSILGKEVPPIKFVPPQELDAMNVNTILELLEEKKSQDNTNMVGGASERPRVTPYKKALEDCLKDLKPLYENATKIERYIDKKATPEANYGPNTKAFTQLYSVLEDNLNKGTNSYINVNPMIFFTIEFPPSRYAKDECKFVFTFKNQQIQYNPPNQSCIDKLNKEYGFDIQEKPEELQTNQAFLKSAGNDTTKDLMTDRVIGLEKLIDAKPSLDTTVPTPTQKVINLMFALGASGTGKTTRYFGFSGATDTGDREGIVPGIVEKAKKTGTNVEVEMGYFVCYGRKEDIGFNPTSKNFSDNSNNKFNELVIFANIDEVNKKMNNKQFNGEFGNDDFYIFNQSTNNPPDSSTYTNFYSNIVSKKLQRINYDSVKDYITNNGPFNIVKTEEFEPCSFREIIQPIGDNIAKYKDLWYKVNDNTNLSELFENLIKAQKCIRTVLPTKNNIESSRGHTCVLIKIIKTNDEGIKETQYFPLFDMAGTENVNAMDNFFTHDRNDVKMNKLIGIISDLSKDDKINDNETQKENKYFASLNDVLKNKEVERYVSLSSSPQTGGGVYNIDEEGKQISQIESNVKYSSITGNNLIQKILGEGYYINHTIGMLIYIAKCIGCSINSPIIDGVDQFDNIQKDVVSQLMNYVNFFNNQGVAQGLGQTRILLDAIDFNTIVSSSTIWIQALLSFLYWNEENNQTFDEILSQCETEGEGEGKDKSKVIYLAEQLDVNNINPEAPANTQKIQLFDDSTINPTYNQFFNNLYSIGGNVIKLDLNALNEKVDTLKQIYPDGKIINEYTLKAEGDNLTFTNETIEAYKAYINKGNELSKEDFYKELADIINENMDSTKNNYTLTFTGHKEETLKQYYLVPIKCEQENNKENTKKCNFNLRKLENSVNELKKLNKSYAVIQRNVIKLKIQILNEYGVKILNEYDGIFDIPKPTENNKATIKKIVSTEPDELLKLLFDYDTNKLIVLNYINNKPNEGINNTLAQQYKSNKETFTSLITLEDKSLSTIAKKFNTDLYYNGKTLKLSKDNKKSTKNLNEIIGDYNTLVGCYNANKPDSNNFQLISNSNQILRIKQSRIGATKMVMMHVVTGQDYKYSTVKETIGLTNTLFDATQIDLKGDNQSSSTTAEQNSMVGGSKYYKINYNFIELID